MLGALVTIINPLNIHRGLSNRGNLFSVHQEQPRYLLSGLTIFLNKLGEYYRIRMRLPSICRRQK